jgi:hypothetical protein
MNWNGVYESLNKIKVFTNRRISIMEDLMSKKDKLRESVSKNFTIRKVKEGRYMSVGAVDSAFDELARDNGGRRLYGVCIAGRSFIPSDGVKEKEPIILQDDNAVSYEENENYRRILEGLAIAKEIHSAMEWFSNMELILIDGAAKSSIIAINQAVTSKNLEKSMSGRELKSIYKDTLDALYDMLNMRVLVFAPKTSSEVLIANKVSPPVENDYALLEIVLDKGEYIMIEEELIQQEQKWSYTLPRIEGVSEEFLSKLFSQLKNLRTIYFKSMSGTIIKLETYVPLSINTLWNFYISKGENILTYMADRSAKNYLRELKDLAKGSNLWKYRI